MALRRLLDGSAGAAATTTFAYAEGSTTVTDPNGHTTTYTYDDDGQVTDTTDATGRDRSSGYSGNGQVTSFTNDSGAQTQMSYDDEGRLTAMSLPTGASASVSYTGQGSRFLAAESEDLQGNIRRLAYDDAGNVTQVEVAGTNTIFDVDRNADGTVAEVRAPAAGLDARPVTGYAYDELGQLATIDHPDPLGDESFTYDAASRVATSTDGTGRTLAYAYDGMDRLTSVTDETDDVEVVYTYDAAGSRTSRSGPEGETTYTYDGLGRVTGRTDDGEQTFTAVYDGVGNLASYTDASGATVGYGYDPINRLASVTQPGGQQTTVAYRDEGDEGESPANDEVWTLPNGVVESVERDDADRVQTIAATDPDGQPLTRFAYDYDAGGDTGLRQSVTDIAGQVTGYAYDALNRLTSAATDGTAVPDYTYGYDDRSNRTAATTPAGRVESTYDAANLLTSSTGPDGTTIDYTWDAAGKMTGSSEGLALGYGPFATTTSIDPAGDGGPVELGYAGPDQFERTRAGQTDFANGLLGVTAQTTAGGTTSFTRTPDGRLLGISTADGAGHWYLTDGLGSIVAVTDTDGEAVNRYRYGPYGEPERADESVANPWRYAGGYHDTQTGLNKFGVRYQDPQLGRWTTQDPIRQLLQPVDANRYTYASSNPTNLTDPTGADVCTTARVQGYSFQPFRPAPAWRH